MWFTTTLGQITEPLHLLMTFTFFGVLTAHPYVAVAVVVVVDVDVVVGMLKR